MPFVTLDGEDWVPALTDDPIATAPMLPDVKY
jgi:hypothetical protein